MTNLYGVVDPLFDDGANIDEPLDGSSIYMRPATESEKWYEKVNQDHTLQKSRGQWRVEWAFSNLCFVRSRDRHDAWDQDHSKDGQQL